MPTKTWACHPTPCLGFCGFNPELFSGKELRPASLEANAPRTWGRLLA
jgi:hypothetical protein